MYQPNDNFIINNYSPDGTYIGPLRGMDSTSSGSSVLISPNDHIQSNNVTVTSGLNIVNGYGVDNKYTVMELLKDNKMPSAVYVCGRMVTLGIIGTDVECAYTGGKLVFESNTLQALKFGCRITVSLEYSDEILHYNIGNKGILTFKPNSTTVESTLVSTIRKDSNKLETT